MQFSAHILQCGLGAAWALPWCSWRSTGRLVAGDALGMIVGLQFVGGLSDTSASVVVLAFPAPVQVRSFEDFSWQAPACEPCMPKATWCGQPENHGLLPIGKVLSEPEWIFTILAFTNGELGASEQTENK